MEDQHYVFNYEFKLNTGETKKFDVSIEQDNLEIVSRQRKLIPEWTKLKFFQCECCSLDSGKIPYCPVSLNISDIIDEFKGCYSTDRCTVSCQTLDRTTYKETDMQTGLFSILGIIMATSGCPMLNLFKPMARFHLPFSNFDEIIIRTTSFYLLRQYFEYKRGNIQNMDMKGLDSHYAAIQQVNKGILARIDAVTINDADKNAIIILHSLAVIFSMNYEDTLHSLERFFV